MITISRLNKHLAGIRVWMEAKGHSKRTVQSYLHTIRMFLTTDPWGDEYKYADIIGYFEKVSKSHLHISTKKLRLVHLKKYYDFLVATNYRRDHPCERFYLDGMTDRSVIQSDLFSMEEMEAVLGMEHGWGGQPEKNKTVMSLLIYQGLTKNEVLKMRTSDIDMENGIIKIRANRKQLARELEIKPRQFAILHKYLNEEREKWLKEETDLLIINQYGKAASIIRYTFEPFKQLYPDRKLEPSTIRESVISHWLNVQKIPMEQVTLMAGLKWISSVERYRHLLKEEEQEILKKFHPMG